VTTVAPAPELDEAEPVFEELDSPPTSAHDRLIAIMNEIQYLRKSEEFRQTSGGAVRYKFRGIDAVMKAVGPLVRKYRILPTPMVQSITQSEYVSSGGTRMCLSVVRVIYRLRGPEGDHVDAEVFGEASDSGDKSVTQALSVAYRTMWLQLLCIPTDTDDPDQHHAPRADAQTEQRVNAQRQQAKATQDVHAELLTVIEEVRVLRNESEYASNERVAKYCRERLETNVVKTAAVDGPIEAIEIRRLSVENAGIMRNAIRRSIKEIKEEQLAARQEV
jgi:hypothetical protein